MDRDITAFDGGAVAMTRCKPSARRRWGLFLLGIVSIWAFIFVLAPLLQRTPYIGEMHDFIQENDIDATALVYTDVEEFGDADVYIRDAVNH